jgi:hypothetical protein
MTKMIKNSELGPARNGNLLKAQASIELALKERSIGFLRVVALDL